MGVREALLGLLCVQPAHGYDLKARYDSLIDPGRSLREPQVYATLNRLARDKLIDVVGEERGAGPVRRTYALTESGRRELERWLATAVQPAPHLHAELYTKVALTTLIGGSVTTLLDRQRQAHVQRMRELTPLRHSSEPSVAVLAEYALFHLEADLRWLEFTAARSTALERSLRIEESQ